MIDAILPPVAVFALLYATLTGWRFALRMRTERPARRKGVALNLTRRAAPPVVTGLMVLLVGAALDLIGRNWPAALLIGAGLAYGLHRGLQEMRQDTSLLIGLRLGASVGLTLAYLWVSGST